LRRRYKRFLADVQLKDGTVITAHTANPGAMQGLVDDGNHALLSLHDNPKRKLPYSLEALHVGTTWVGVNTGVANAFARGVIERGLIPQLANFAVTTSEVKYGAAGRSRVDLVLEQHPHKPKTFVEVKSVTMREGSRALFPDAVTLRGQKHIEDLRDVVQQGFDAAFVFVVQRTDCASFGPAWRVDPTYARELLAASRAGVQTVAIVARVDAQGLWYEGALPVELEAP
jgi:sugar fermentation stimulation protein A